MSSENQEEQDFVRAYTGVLVAAWSDSAYAKRLESSPESAAAEAGLHVPAGVRIDLVRDAPAAGDGRSSEEYLQEQYQLWLAGEETGVAVLHVPPAPPVDSTSLSLEDLESVSGGVVMCCCCPCSCSL